MKFHSLIIIGVVALGMLSTSVMAGDPNASFSITGGAVTVQQGYRGVSGGLALNNI